MTTTMTSPHSSESTTEKENVLGKPDATLIGDTTTSEYNDAIGFQTPGKVVETRYDRPSEDLRLLSTLRPSHEMHHSIETILSRPVRIGRLEWTSQAQRGSILGTYDITTQMVRDNFRLLRQKLSGFYGFHATCTLKVLVNPQPFESGLFQIFYIPFQKSLNTFPVQYNGTEMSLPFTTGCPNVYCNITLQSSVELSMPYTGPQAFINLAQLADREWGTFYVQNIVPIQDGTNQARAEMSVYMYFTNVKLYGATPLTWSTQGDNCRKKEEATKQSEGNPISNLVGDVVRTATGLGPALDLLGLSKPVVNQNPSRMIISPYANVTLADSSAACLKLSFQDSQATEIGQLGVDAVDEMDIGYVVSKPTYFTIFNWASSNVTGSRLISLPVSPNCVLSDVRSTGFEYAAPTRLRYISSLFRFWRGTIRYTFHVVATKFHSGRLRFVYTLGGKVSSNLAVEFPYTFSQVVDLRDGLTFAVDVPYFASTPWRSVPKNWDTQNKIYTDDDSSAFDDQESFLEIFVENQLTAQSTATSTLSIVVMASGGGDYEVAAPSCSVGFPARIYTPAPNQTARSAVQRLFTSTTQIPSSTTSTTTEKPQKDWQPEEMERPYSEYDPIRTREKMRKGQANMETQGEVLDIPVVNMVAEESMPGTSTDQASPITVGEHIKNLRTLLRRYFPVGYATSIPTGSVAIFPFVINEPFIEGNQSEAGDDSRSYEFLAMLWPMYRFYRGGMRLLFAEIDPASALVKFDPYLNPRIVKSGAANQFGRHLAAFAQTDLDTNNKYINAATPVTQPFNTNLQGGVDIEVPYYARTHKLITTYTPTDNYTGVVTLTQRRFYPDGVVYIKFKPATTTNSGVTVFRAVADDFNFGFLLGAPIVTVNESFSLM